MEQLQELQASCESYIKQTTELKQKAGAFDGFLGLGKDPKRDACHKEFYEEVGAIIGTLKEASPQELAEIVAYILRAEDENKDQPMAGWMLIAIQGHTLGLIPQLTPATADELFAWYEKRYPRRMRLPVQDQVFTALKKQRKK